MGEAKKQFEEAIANDEELHAHVSDTIQAPVNAEYLAASAKNDTIIEQAVAEQHAREDAKKELHLEKLTDVRRRLLRRRASEHPMDRLKRRLLQQNRYSRAYEHPMDRLKRRRLQQNRY